MNLAFALVLATTISTSQVPTATVVGPIPTIAPGSWTWQPGARTVPDLPMPDLMLGIDTWLGVAYYWVKTTFIETDAIGYYLIYNFAVAVLGSAFGNVLGRGGFFRYMSQNRPGSGVGEILTDKDDKTDQ